MKIVVLHRYPPRQVVGTNASFLESIKLLSKNNEVYYLTYKDNSVKEKELTNINYLRIPLVFNRGNNLDKKLKTWIWIFLSPLYVKYLQIKFGIEVVYCDDSVPFYGYFTKILCPSLKVVIRLGDLQTAYALSDNHPFLFKLSQFIEAFMWKKMDALIAISQSFKNYIVKQGVKKSRVFVVEESINLDTKKLSKAKKNSKQINLIFHGALLKCKGVEKLIHAFGSLSKKHKNLHLTIAGGGDEEEKLKTLAKKLKLKNITFTGWYNLSQLDSIMSQADIGVVMRNSNLANNFVVTTCLLENWSYKLPVLVPNLSSFKKLITDNKNGIFFEPDNEQDLASRIKFLLENKQGWKSLGEAGLETAKKFFNHNLIAKKMSLTLNKIYEK